MKILLVSNGHAEDLAAAGIGRQIKIIQPDAEIFGLPMVGMGKAYDQAGISNLGIKKVMPSGGFAKEGLDHFLNDLGSGLISTLAKQIKILRQNAGQSRLIVCVGDVFLAALCGIFGRKPVFYIDGPNSVRIRPYYRLEKIILKIFCKKIIVQDRETAGYLQKENLPGIYLGTWVMDYVKESGEDFGLDKNREVIGILPGTRDEAYANFQLILKVLDPLTKEKKDFVGLAAFALDKEIFKDRLKNSIWKYQEFEKKNSIFAALTHPSGAKILMAEGKFADVCKRSKIILGMAGIANEQAAGFGAPVIAFEGTGPQTTMRRWQEIKNITGDSMAVLSGTPEEIARKTLEILNDEKQLARMREIGLLSKKDQGGIKRIADLIVSSLNL